MEFSGFHMTKCAERRSKNLLFPNTSTEPAPRVMTSRATKCAESCFFRTLSVLASAALMRCVTKCSGKHPFRTLPCTDISNNDELCCQDHPFQTLSPACLSAHHPCFHRHNDIPGILPLIGTGYQRHYLLCIFRHILLFYMKQPQSLCLNQIIL